MVTYKDAIWQLALSKAHMYYGGDMMPRADGYHIVAWIYEMSTEKVIEDINAVYEAACEKALHG